MSNSSTQFNDNKTIEEKTRWLDAYAENQYLESYKKQCETDLHHPWGENLNVLIISDRCPGRAKGLCEYLTKKTNISNALLCTTFPEASAVISYTTFNILVFVGYQENKTNYEIKSMLMEKNPNACIVKYAFLDSLIKQRCIDYNIQFAFSSQKPVAEFVEYLKESYSMCS